jgi:hypothetical protein
MPSAGDLNDGKMRGLVPPPKIFKGLARSLPRSELIADNATGHLLECSLYCCSSAGDRRIYALLSQTQFSSSQWVERRGSLCCYCQDHK